MIKLIDNMAIIGGDNELPLLAYKALKKKYKNSVYINLSFRNKKYLKAKSSYNLKIFELEKCIRLLNDHHVKKICFLGTVSRPNFNKLKLDRVLKKYINEIILSSKKGDGFILDSIINIFRKEGFEIFSFIDIFSDEFLLDSEHLKPSNIDLKDIDKGRKILDSLSDFDNAQACVVSNGYVLAIEAAEGTDRMLNRLPQVKKKIARYDIDEGCLIKLPKINQSLKIDLPTVGIKTIELMSKSKLIFLAVNQKQTIVVNKAEFYKKLKKEKIGLSFIS
jgi:DUF1009 family protein